MKSLTTYIRSSREPRVLSARLDQSAIQKMDPILERLGYQRVGKQEELEGLGLVRCSKCNLMFPRGAGVCLPDENWCRGCIKVTFGGHKV